MTACPTPSAPAPTSRFALRARVREYFRRLMETPGRIEEVAGGFAIGVFFGCSPWQGFHFLLTLAFCALLRRNLAAGIIGATAFNALTALPIFALELEVGLLLTGSHHPVLPAMTFDLPGLRRLFDAGATVFAPYLLGSIIVGAVGAATSYFWLRGALRAYHKRIYLRRHHGPDA